ncbi:MAG: SAM-dependent methyltransferase [Thermoplasmata archaeon]|nr:SAM-dependent methyltransferase [Thermoplasmata archaeon]
MRQARARTGRLIVVGVGIKAARHVSVEARHEIQHADRVLYLVADGLAEAWLRKLRPTAESLGDAYRPGEDRSVAYGRMVDRILSPVRAGERVCAVFYGHPGVFVHPSHEAIRRAREEGLSAEMLPAISAEDCLFADLGVDPARSGCQSFEATDFLVHVRKFDPTSALVLWQVGVIGVLDYRPDRSSGIASALRFLGERLSDAYGSRHEVVLYEASPYVVAGPTILRLPIEGLASATVAPVATLFVPPLPSHVSEDALQRLRIPRRETDPSPASRASGSPPGRRRRKAGGRRAPARGGRRPPRSPSEDDGARD